MDDTDNQLSRGQVALGIVALIVISVLVLAAIVGVIIAIAPERPAQPTDPTFLDNVFNSRTMIIVARGMLIIIAGYVALSIVGHVIRGRWIEEAGPVKVAAKVEQATERSTELQDAYQEVLLENQHLAQQLADQAGVIDELTQALVELDPPASDADTPSD